MREAGVVIDLRGAPLHWHVPFGRTGASLPDSRQLWDVLWENREEVLGFAHTHPGSGEPAPSHEDLTTFAAVEAALGRRLYWWIASSDAVVFLQWVGPERLAYERHPIPVAYSWINHLRKLSNGGA